MGTAIEKEWWRGAVLYQIYPRSYQDSNGDGIGDLPGIIERLEHVAKLGVDAVWLSPFFTSPMLDFGYDVSNYRDVDPIFGSLNDFQKLIARAKELNLKIIIDLVLSHSSNQHPWFLNSKTSRESEKNDWYVWADPKPDGTVPNNWLSIFGGSAWEWSPVRRQYYLHNFLKEQPDLNFHNSEVRAELLDIARFWLELGVAGFRLDTVNFYVHDKLLRDNPPAPNQDTFEIPLSNPYAWQDHLYDKTQPENLRFIEELREVMDGYEATTTVGEIGDGARALQTMALYTEGHKRLHMCYSFDFLSRAFSKNHIAQTINAFEKIAGEGWPCWAFSNHDVERHISRWQELAPDPENFGRFCLALLIALRGTICLYEGEELGLTEASIPFEALQDPYGKTFWPEFKGRDGCRTPMVWDADLPQAGFSTAEKTWLPVAPEHIPHAVIKAGVENNNTLLKFYRELIKLRHSNSLLRNGEITVIETQNDVLALCRFKKNEAVLCLFNFAKNPENFLIPENLIPQDILFNHESTLNTKHVTLRAGGILYINCKFLLESEKAHGHYSH